VWSWVKEFLGLDGQKYGRFYVYELLDPRFQPPRTFYIGKGTEDRMYEHEKETRRLLKRSIKSKGAAMAMSCKHKRILEIWDDGYEVGHEVVFRTDNEQEAYQVESRRIDHFGLERLTNETYGYKPRRIA